MMLRVHSLQPVERNVRINLRSRNIGVTENGLYRAQVGPVLHHMGGAGVAKHVRTGVASRGETGIAYQLPNSLTGQTTAPKANK